LNYQELVDGFQVTVFDSYFNAGKDIGYVITDVQEKIYGLMKGNPIITISELASAVNTTTRTIERNISVLKKKRNGFSRRTPI
jgi:predicted HTH transcriptional regulator